MYDVQGIFKVKYFPSVNSMYLLAHRRKFMNPECVEIRNFAMSQMAKTYAGAKVPDKVKLYWLSSQWLGEFDNLGTNEKQAQYLLQRCKKHLDQEMNQN